MFTSTHNLKPQDVDFKWILSLISTCFILPKVLRLLIWQAATRPWIVPVEMSFPTAVSTAIDLYLHCRDPHL